MATLPHNLRNVTVVPTVSVMENFEALALKGDLADPTLAANGDGMVIVRKTNAAAAIATTQHVINEGRMIDLKADYGLVGDGSTTGNVAKMVAACANGGDFWLPSGVYLWDADFIIPSNCRIFFAKGAKLLANANGRTFFKTTVNTFYNQVHFANLDHNGFTGVTGFDYIGVRHSSGIYWPTFSNGLANGVILRQLCWDFEIVNPFGQGVTNAIRVLDGSNAVRIEKPSFDGLGSTGSGIKVETGPNYATTTVRIVGGYIQGYANGVHDGGIGTIIDGVYFETCTSADVFFDGSIRGAARSTQHYAGVGPVAIKGRNCDGVTVDDPTMTSGSRSLGLFDFDGTNANCHALRVATVGGLNIPEGVVTGIGSIPTEDSGTFMPVIEGSTTTGAGTYTTQSGTWRRIGKQVHAQIEVAWTAHTGTGNIIAGGIPVFLTPTSFTPRRLGQLSFDAGVSVTNPLVFAYLNGTNTKLSLLQVSTAGSAALIPLASTGSIYINIVYDL